MNWTLLNALKYRGSNSMWVKQQNDRWLSTLSWALHRMPRYNNPGIQVKRGEEISAPQRQADNKLILPAHQQTFLFLVKNTGISRCFQGRLRESTD